MALGMGVWVGFAADTVVMPVDAPLPKPPPVVDQLTDAQVVLPKKQTDSQVVLPDQDSGSKAFVDASGPPPGFEASSLMPTGTNIIDVYSGDQFLASVPVDYSTKTMKVLAPEALLEKVPDIASGAHGALLEALSEPLPTHMDLLCPEEQNPLCHVFKPSVLGFIFDPMQSRAYLFINPRYLTLNRPDALVALGPSSAGLSYLFQNNFFLLGGVGDRTVSWRNTETIASGESRVVMQWFAQQTRSDSQDKVSRLELQQLNFRRVQSEDVFEMGLLSTKGGDDFILSQQYMGFGFNNQRYTAVGAVVSDYAATPLEVYLTMPSTVKVEKDGAVIYVGQFPAGRHELDTRTFPSGGYDVRIVMTDTYGNVTEERAYFSKQDELPGMGRTSYSFGFGIRQETVQTSGNDFFLHPHFQDQAIFYYHGIRALSAVWGLSGTALLNGGELYVAPSAVYYHGFAQIRPGMLLSNRNNYGLSLHGVGSYQAYTGDLQVIRLFSRDHVVGGDNTGVVTTNSPILTNDFQLRGSVGANYGDLHFTGSMRLLRNLGQDTQTSYGVTATKQLIQSGTSNMSLSVSLTHSDRDQVVLATLNWTFNNPDYRANTFGGYRASREDSAGSARYTLTGDVTKIPIHTQDKRVEYTVSGHADDLTQYVGLAGRYESTRLLGVGSFQRNYIDTGDNTTYALSVDSNIAIVDGHVVVGYSPTWQTGVMVEVTAKTPVEADIMVDGAKVGSAQTGVPRVVYLQPFRAYEIGIVANSDELYQYDQAPRAVTLYQGNIKRLSWHLAEEYLLFSQVVDAAGKPISDALVMSGGEYNATDGQGYIQLSVTDQDREVVLRQQDGVKCVVVLPKDVAVEEGVAQVEHLVCQ